MEIYRSLPVTLHLHIHKYHRELYHFLVCKIFGCNILPRHIFSQFNSYSILWLELMSWTTAYLSNVTTHSAAWAIFMWLPSPNSVYCCVYHSSCCLCNGTLHAATYTMKAMDEQIPKKCIEEKKHLFSCEFGICCCCSFKARNSLAHRRRMRGMLLHFAYSFQIMWNKIRRTGEREREESRLLYAISR